MNTTSFLSTDAYESKGEEDACLSIHPEFTSEKEKLSAELWHSRLLSKRLLQNIFHEINTPLTSLITLTETLLLEWDNLTDAKKKEWLLVQLQRAEYLFSYLDKLRVLRRQVNRTLEMRFESLCLQELIYGILEQESKTRKSYKPVFLKSALPGEREATIVADTSWIRAVIEELIDNSWRFTEEGSITVALYPSSLKTPKGDALPAWTIEVRDTGIGVPEEELHRIFMAFYESSRTRSKTEGRGLGLAVAEAIVSAHHGTISARNNAKGGLTVSLVLPETQPKHSPGCVLVE